MKSTLRKAQWPVWYAARIIRSFFPWAAQPKFSHWKDFKRDSLLLAWIGLSFVSLHFIWIGFVGLYFRYIYNSFMVSGVDDNDPKRFIK